MLLRTGQYLYDRYNCYLKSFLCVLEYTITHVLICCTEQIVLDKKQDLNGFSLRQYRTHDVFISERVFSVYFML